MHPCPGLGTAKSHTSQNGPSNEEWTHQTYLLRLQELHDLVILHLAIQLISLSVEIRVCHGCGVYNGRARYKQRWTLEKE